MDISGAQTGADACWKHVLRREIYFFIKHGATNIVAVIRDVSFQSEKLQDR